MNKKTYTQPLIELDNIKVYDYLLIFYYKN